MALTYLNSKMIEEPAVLGQLYVTSLTALSSTIQNTLTNDLTAINLTGDSVISVDTPGNALRITQRGAGNALVVEDSANPDSTPFVIKSDGKVGIRTTEPGTELDVNGIIRGTNLTITNTGTVPILNATNITTQNLSFPENGTGSIINDAAFFGNLTIYGAISALSGLAVTSTFTSQSSALSVVNTGPEVALYVSQGPNLSGVATFIGSGTEILKINNPDPNPFNLPGVVVNGVLSAGSGTSTNWNNIFTNVQSNSANWTSAYTASLSSNLWNSNYTNVQTNSANWNFGYNVATYVQANSASWNYQGTDIKALTANWQSTYATVCSLSASWEESADIIPTVINYLSSNNVQVSALSLSSVTFTNRYVVATTLTANNTVLEVIVGGVPMYLPFYNITI